MARRRTPLSDILWAFAVYVCRVWDIALPGDLRTIIATRPNPRRVIYRLPGWYVSHAVQSWYDRRETLKAAKRFMRRLWREGPGPCPTDDLEMAAVLHFLAEELRWP